jgi:uncharacterized membrane-anchored protein
VPEVTIFFWLTVVLTSAVGGVFTNFFYSSLDIGLTITTVLVITLLSAVMPIQAAVPRYVPGLYWFAILLISVFGALLVSNLTDVLDVSLPAATVGFAISLIVASALRHYWLTVVLTFALGSTLARLGAERIGLSYGTITVACTVLLAVVTLRRHFSAVTFGIALLVARLLGTALGAFLSQSPDTGGLGLGAFPVAAAAMLAGAGVVVYLSISDAGQRFTGSAGEGPGRGPVGSR